MLGTILLMSSIILISLVILVIKFRREAELDREIRSNFNQNRRDLIIDQYGEDW